LKRQAFRRRLAVTLYRTLYWGRNHVRPGLRSLIGVCFMVGGVFGFLPILGFWMFPLGMAFVALDIPSMRHRIDAWMLRLAIQGKLDLPGRLGAPQAPVQTSDQQPAPDREPPPDRQTPSA